MLGPRPRISLEAKAVVSAGEVEIEFIFEEGLPSDQISPAEPDTYEISAAFMVKDGTRHCKVSEEFIDEYDTVLLNACKAAVMAHFED